MSVVKLTLGQNYADGYPWVRLAPRQENVVSRAYANTV